MTKQSWERVVLVCRDADVAVWGANPGGRGWEGGFLSVFWASGGEGEWACCVVSWAKWGRNLCGSLPWVFPLRDSGFVPLRGIAFEHFVHVILSMGLGPLFSIVEHDIYVHG